MFHVEIRSTLQVVREFNLSNERLWVEFLMPLMSGVDFTVEGHEFVPRQTRLRVYEGPELRLDQLGMGRGWQNVERTAADVTERVLAQAREHASHAQAGEHTSQARPDAGAPGAVDLVRERLIGRIAAGPIAAPELLEVAAELMPQATEQERLEVVQRAAWELLERGAAQLAPSGR